LRYGCIMTLQAEYPVSVLCAVLQVSRSGYYDWRERPDSPRTQANTALTEVIKEIHRASRDTYGSPRIHAELRARGHACGRKRVARLMQAHRLRGRPAHLKVSTTQRATEAPPIPDLLERDFTASAPNQKWVADITYIRTGEGWLYLAAVMDLFSRMIVGWAMLPRITEDVVCLALQMALHRRVPPANLIHHSDHGSQYTSRTFRELLAQHQIQLSMGSTGDCFDNAAMESFFATLKRECVCAQIFPSRAVARTTIFEYIETFYNRVRRHSALDYHSPFEFEQLYTQNLSQHPLN